MSKENTNLSRRNFLKSGAVLAAGAATLGIVGCAPGGDTSGTQSAGTSTNWDKTADIVVVGTGTAIIAALAASDFGAESVIVIDKADTFGGTTATSGGGVGIPMTHIATDAGVTDSMDQVKLYYQNASQGRADMDVVENYVTNGDKFLTWTEDKFGFTWGFTQKMYQDYYEPVEGYLGFGRGNISVQQIGGEPNESMGAGTWAFLQQQVQADEKIELMQGTPAIELVTDENGAVIGVIAEPKGGTIAIGANKAVILGTGGFEHDDSMRAKYLPYPILSLTSSVANTGDGHKMGMRIGADLAHMDRNWGLPAFFVSGENADDLLANGQAAVNYAGMDANTYRSLPGTIVVNSKGQRIGNECASYDTFNRAFGRFDSDLSTMANIPAYFIIDSAVAGVYRLPGQAAAGDPMPDFYQTGATLEELATNLGIDVDGFTKEMADFNANAANGVDPKFHRGAHEFDINTDAVYAGNREDLPNPVLAPLATGPFYGTIIVPGTFGTCGGLKVDKNAQVLNVDGDVIPGLFAVGNCSSGVSGGAYCHGGMTVGSGSVMSWVAARFILGVTD